jgi:GDPmannose 4,6-dehydratase
MPILITGAAGQDGILLARKLLKTETDVVGICRKNQAKNLRQAVPGLSIYTADLTDFEKVHKILDKAKPTTIFNLAGYSSVNKSWMEPEIATRINSDLPVQILSWTVKKSPTTRIIQASSSEIFGATTQIPQTENTNIKPITPYGLSKSLAFEMMQIFRSKEGIHATNMILYNHESPLRREEFVTRRITKSVAQIKLGKLDTLHIGNIGMKRDWGWAPDYIDGMILASNKELADDYILATGILHSVKDIIETAFTYAGIENFEKYIHADENMIRKIDPQNLLGNPTKAETRLGWKRTLEFKEIIETMVKYDLQINPNSIWDVTSG